LTNIEANEEAFFSRIITGDETWVYQYDPETKQQSKQWLPRGSAGPIKFKSERSVNKVMAAVFWDSEGVVLVDFLESQKTVTGSYYVEALRKLRAELAKRRPGKLHRGILFHHDNAPAHSARVTEDIMREFRWELLPHPPYRPDLAPSDFFLFQNSKNI
jgi:histone-lysine N-methyltransferase SETMAR